MPPKIRASSYYNYNRLFSYNGVFNFILGGRGIGKTYGAQKRAINRAIKYGEEFVYIRRYADELAMSKGTFFDAISQEFPKYEFRSIVESKIARAQYTTAIPDDFGELSAKEQNAYLKNRVWKTIGYFTALSQAQRMKSSSYPRVKLMIFDEFILEKGRTIYLQEEYSVFQGLYETIDRKKDTTKVLFLANAVSIDNPYFIHYGIDPDDAAREIVSLYDGFIVVHFPESKAYQEDAKKTRFGRFLRESDPTYADYAIGNQFKDNHKLLIAGKDYKADYLYTLETSKGSFSVWNKFGSSEFYVQAKLPKVQKVYTTVMANMSTEKIYVDRTSRTLAYLRGAWSRGDVLFDSAGTRVAFLDIFHR